MIGSGAANVPACATRQTSLVKRCTRARRASERPMPRTVSRKDFLRFGGVGLTGVALLGAAGCGRRLGGNRDVVKFLTGAEETTIQERAVTEIQVNRFEEQHPKYTLEREAIDPDAMSNVIPSRLRSDEPPDVISFDTGPGLGGVLADAGLVYPLEKTYKEKGWDIYEWAKQRATYNGTVYGVPDQVEEIIVYYNKDLMPEEPQTLEELRRVAEEHKLQGTIPLAFGNREQYPAGHLFSIGASNLLGRQGLDDILYGNGRWDVPEVVRAIDLFFRDFVESGYYPRNVNAATFDEASTLFYSGEAAMLPTGTWLVTSAPAAGMETRRSAPTRFSTPTYEQFATAQHERSQEEHGQGAGGSAEAEGCLCCRHGRASVVPAASSANRRKRSEGNRSTGCRSQLQTGGYRIRCRIRRVRASRTADMQAEWDRTSL